MALTRCSMQSCGTLLSSAGKTRTSLITGFNKHESRLVFAVLLSERCPPGAVCVGAGCGWVLWAGGAGWLWVVSLGDSFQPGSWPSLCQCQSSGAGSCVLCQWAELCLWQLTAQLLCYKIMDFMGLGRHLCASPASDVFCAILFPSTALVLN